MSARRDDETVIPGGDDTVPDFITQTDAHGNSSRGGLAQTTQTQKQESIGLLSIVFYRICCCVNVEPIRKPLLPPQNPRSRGKKCLILDLDETLVHSAFARVENPDYMLSVKLDQKQFAGKEFKVYVLKRPGLREFLKAVSKVYEVVVFTASLERYARPLLELLDEDKVIDFRLYRSACTEHLGNYVKDLRLLGRDLKQTIIVDNSPASYQFQRENAIGCSSFIDDKSDRELYYCKDFLLSPVIAGAKDVRHELTKYPDFVRQREFSENSCRR